MDNPLDRHFRPRARSACGHPTPFSLSMTFIQPLLRLIPATLILASVCATWPAQADSLASSASSAGSSASGSVSDSLHGSSNSSADSSRDGREVANGDYRILALAPVPERPGKLRLTLQWQPALPADQVAAAADPALLMLDLPAEVVQAQGLDMGGTVHAERRVYGIEFSRPETRKAFFLVLADDWHDDLAARRVIGL